MTNNDWQWHQDYMEGFEVEMSGLELEEMDIGEYFQQLLNLAEELIEYKESIGQKGTGDLLDRINFAQDQMHKEIYNAFRSEIEYDKETVVAD